MMEEMAWKRKTRERLEAEAAGGSGGGSGGDARGPPTYDPNCPLDDRSTPVLRIAVASALHIEIGPWDSETTAVHEELVHACHDLLLGMDELNAAEEMLAKDKRLGPGPPAPAKPPPGMDMFQEMAWRKEQKAKAAAAAAGGGGEGEAAGQRQTTAQRRGAVARPSSAGDRGSSSSSARKAELEKLPAFKLKAAAKEAGVPPLAIGVPVRTKEETIALILELEAGAGGGAGAQPVSAGARPPPAPTSVAPRAPPAPAAPQTSMSRSVSKPGRGAVEELVE